MKVSMIPRSGSALGYAQYLPSEDPNRTSDEIVNSICVALGGRIAEQIFFNHWSTGASDDLSKVTRYAYLHASAFNRSTVYPAPGTSHTAHTKPFGDGVSSAVDKAAMEIINIAYDKTMKLLIEKKEEMVLLANHLLEHEVMTRSDVENYLGKEPLNPRRERKFV